MIERFRRWFRYEIDAHEKMLASLHTVPRERRDSDGFRKALELCAHLFAARLMWLHRLGALASPPGGWFPTDVTLDGLAARAAAAHTDWQRYLDRLDDAALQGEITYASSEGPRYCSKVEDVLTQLFAHSSYHRGQVAARVRECGGEPAVTDFVFWSRRPAS